MDWIRYLIQDRLPAYLRELPLPSTFGDLFRLSPSQYVALMPLLVTLAVSVATVVLALRSVSKRPGDAPAPSRSSSPRSSRSRRPSFSPSPVPSFEMSGSGLSIVDARSSPVPDASDRKHRVNRRIRLTEAKIVTNTTCQDIENLGKVSFCRCWKSSKFPYCDSTHNSHNAETGDNVGPLVISAALLK